jgi:hypothetical protein
MNTRDNIKLLDLEGGGPAQIDVASRNLLRRAEEIYEIYQSE